MKIRHMILFATAAVVAFEFAGLARVLYVLRPELLVLLYTILLIGAVAITYILACLPDRRATTKSLVAGLLLGFTIDVADRALDTGSEIFDPRRAVIEKSFLEFQAGACKAIHTEMSNLAVDVLILDAQQQSGPHALVLSGVADSEIGRMVSEASYQSAEKISRWHGFKLLFDRLKSGIYVWDIRSASCIRQP